MSQSKQTFTFFYAWLLLNASLSGQVVEENFLAAPLLNAQSIQNYDCLAVSESVFIPDATKVGDAGYYLEIFERVIADYRQDSFLYAVKRKYSAVDPKRSPKMSEKLPFEQVEFYDFEQGRPIRPRTNRKFDCLSDFAKHFRLPFMDLACVNGHPYAFSQKTRDDHIQTRMKDPPRRGTIQPDGSIAVSHDNNSHIDTFFVDPSTLMFNRFVRRISFDSKLPVTKVYTDKRYIYKEEKNIQLLIESNFEHESSPLCDYREVGTTQIEWLEVNAPALEFPSITFESIKDGAVEKLLHAPKRKDRKAK